MSLRDDHEEWLRSDEGHKTIRAAQDEERCVAMGDLILKFGRALKRPWRRR